VYTCSASFRRNAGSGPVCGRDLAFRRNTVTSLRQGDACRALAADLAPDPRPGHVGHPHLARLPGLDSPSVGQRRSRTAVSSHNPERYATSFKAQRGAEPARRSTSSRCRAIDRKSPHRSPANQTFEHTQRREAFPTKEPSALRRRFRSRRQDHRRPRPYERGVGNLDEAAGGAVEIERHKQQERH
jgi:hypothetical protein